MSFILIQAVYKGKTDLKEIPGYNSNIEIVTEHKKPAPVAEPSEAKEEPEVVVEDGEAKPEGEVLAAEGEAAEVPAEGEVVEPPPAADTPAEA